MLGVGLLILDLGYGQATTATLMLVGMSTLVCMAIGVPFGVLAARWPWVYCVMRPVLDLMQSIAIFVYLVPKPILFRLGMVPGLISTAVFASPAPICLTHLGIASVPTHLLEPGDAFGATRLQHLLKVKLPHVMPAIMAGLRQGITPSLSMVVIAALIGADGLGKPVVQAVNQVNIAKGFEAGLASVPLAIVLDRVCRCAKTRPYG